MANLNIREYDSNAQLQPSDRGPESFNVAGRRIGALYSEAGSAQQAAGRAIGSGIAEAGEQVAKYAGQREISHAAVGFAGLQLAATTDWEKAANDAAAKDPNDPTVAQKFLQDHLEPALEKFRSGFVTEAGQRWADERINALRQHFTTKTISDMSTLAGHAAVVNEIQTENTLANAAAKDHTPLGIQLALDSLKASVDGITGGGNLSATDAAKIRDERMQMGSQNIVKAGIQAAMWDNPDKAAAMAQDPRFAKYINASEINSFQHQVQTMKKQDALLARQQQHEQQQQNNEKSMDTFLKDVYGDNPTMTAEKIANLDPQVMDSQHKRIAIGILRQELKPEADAKVYQRNASELFNRLIAPTGDETRITDKTPLYQALAKGDIGQSQFNFLEKRFDQARNESNQRLTDLTREMVQSVKELILKPNPVTKIFPTSGPELYAFQYDLAEAVEKARKTGDVQDLFNPHSPKYFATRERIAGYQTDMQTAIKRGTDAMKSKPLAKLSPDAEAARKLMFGDGPTKPEIPSGR